MEKFIFHELPFFSGSQNVVDWIDTVERAGSFAKWDDEDLRKVPRPRIRGETSEYIGHLELEDKAATWTTLDPISFMPMTQSTHQIAHCIYDCIY